MWTVKTEGKSMFKRFDVGTHINIVNLAQITYIELKDDMLTFFKNDSRFSIKFDSALTARSIFDDLWEYVR